MIGLDVRNKVFTEIEVLDVLIDDAGNRWVVLEFRDDGIITCTDMILESELLSIMIDPSKDAPYSTNYDLNLNDFYIQNGGHHDIVFDTVLKEFYHFKKDAKNNFFRREAPDTDLKLTIVTHEGRTYFDRHSKRGTYHETVRDQKIPIRLVDFDFYYILNSRIFFFKKHYKSNRVTVVGSIYEVDGYFFSVFNDN